MSVSDGNALRLGESQGAVHGTAPDDRGHQHMAIRPALTRGQKALIVIVVAGAASIALIGFVGSYTAVRQLAYKNGFGWFSYVLPVGIDVGITLFLALDLLLTWLRMPLAVLRYLAWVLTGATIVFNADTAWPKPIGTAMHAVVPLLFVAAIEAARHAVGRMAQLTTGQLMESTRLGRWILAPINTFRLWRRRYLWELRSYEETVQLERRRLIYREYLRSQYGRRWRKVAPVGERLPLKLARFGEPLPIINWQNAATPAPAAREASAVQAPQQLDTSPEAWATDPAPMDQSRPIPGPRPATELEQEPEPELEPMKEADPAAGAPDEDAEPRVALSTGAPAVETAPGTLQGSAAPPPPVSGIRIVDRYFDGLCGYVEEFGSAPDPEQLAAFLFAMGVTGRGGKQLSANSVRRYLPELLQRYESGSRALADAR
jgi:hypothetical protein